MTDGQRAVLSQPGWDQDLSIEPQERPVEPVGDEVLVRLKACGLCHRDLIDRSGRFPFLRTPIVPGHEAAGTVVSVGSQVTDFGPDDRVGTLHRDHCGRCPDCERGETSLCTKAFHVFGLLADGGYATWLKAPQRALYALPEGMDFATGAILPCTFGTAWRGLTRFGPPRAGDRVLITGANGGVGSAALQLCQRLGIESVAVIRDERHEAFCRRQGADEVVVRPSGPFHESLPGGPVDLALECVGQATFNSSLRSLKMGGGLSIIGNVQEVRAELNLGLVVVKGLRIAGSSGATHETMRALAALHAERPFIPAIAETYGLEQADTAQRRLRAGGVQGRLILEMGGT